MESTYLNFCIFEKELYKFKDIEELYYKLFDILSLICFNNGFFCFCDRYQGCELDYNQGQRLPTLSDSSPFLRL